MHRLQFTQGLVKSRAALGLRRKRGRVPRQKHPTAIAAQYYAGIRRVLDMARAVVHRDLLPVLPALLADAQSARGDDLNLDTSQRLKAAIDETIKEFDRQYKAQARELEELATRTAQHTASFQADQLGAQIRAKLGVDLPMSDAGLGQHISDFVTENVSLIQSVPDKYLDRIGQDTLAAVRSGMRHEDLADQLAKDYDISDDRAALIARDQVGKFYGELNKVRQEGLGIDGYIWQTSNDNRVRPEHEERQGKPFKWADPPEDGPPGMAILCRCYSEPDVSGILNALTEE